ncbi:MAG: hypothetical protein V9G42_06170 [Bacteroidia bacterium]
MNNHYRALLFVCRYFAQQLAVIMRQAHVIGAEECDYGFVEISSRCVAGSFYFANIYLRKEVQPPAGGYILCESSSSNGVAVWQAVFAEEINIGWVVMQEWFEYLGSEVLVRAAEVGFYFFLIGWLHSDVVHQYAPTVIRVINEIP